VVKALAMGMFFVVLLFSYHEWRSIKVMMKCFGTVPISLPLMLTTGIVLNGSERT